MSKANPAQTFNLVNEDVLNNCVSAIVDGFKAGDAKVVVIKSASEARSAAQLRLKWMWMGYIAKHMIGTGKGLSKQGWNRLFKDRFMKALLIDQDQDYVQFYTRIENLRSGLPTDRFLRNRLIDLIQTEWLDVAHMSQFLDQIDQYARDELGLQLPVPEDLKWIREVK